MEFGNQEQGYALGAGRRAFNTGQYRVDDVVAQIMFACGDENFRSLDSVGAVFFFYGRGGQCTDVGSGFGFGEQHGAAPFTGKHFFHGKAFSESHPRMFQPAWLPRGSCRNKA